MKKIICFYFLFFALWTVQSQIISPKPHPYTSGVDDKLQLLDKSAVTTDILYDRVYPFAQLRNFNQVGADTSQANHFFHAYAELQNADYTSRWASVSQLMNQVEAQPQNQIPIGIKRPFSMGPRFMPVRQAGIRSLEDTQDIGFSPIPLTSKSRIMENHGYCLYAYVENILTTFLS